VIPLGKPVPTGIVNTSLLYNEFIVYDVAQVSSVFMCLFKIPHPLLSPPLSSN